MRETLTVDELMALRPCPNYPRERVEELWAGREALTLVEILELAIPEPDRWWVICQPGVLPESLQRWMACDCADLVAHLRAPGDTQSAETVRVARRYALGAATDDELARAVRAATWEAWAEWEAWAATWVAWGAARAAWAEWGAARAEWEAWAATQAATQAATWDHILALGRAYLTGERVVPESWDEYVAQLGETSG